MNSVCVNSQNSNVNFGCGWIKKAKVMYPSFADRIVNPRNMSRLERGLNRDMGARVAKKLNDKSPKEIRNVIEKAMFNCDYDFLKGLNSALDKNLAKKAYAMLSL